MFYVIKWEKGNGGRSCEVKGRGERKGAKKREEGKKDNRTKWHSIEKKISNNKLQLISFAGLETHFHYSQTFNKVSCRLLVSGGGGFFICFCFCFYYNLLEEPPFLSLVSMGKDSNHTLTLN